MKKVIRGAENSEPEVDLSVAQPADPAGHYPEACLADKDGVIRAEWAAGTSLTKIGAMVGCSRALVKLAARRLELPARLELPYYETWPEADLETLRSEWMNGTPASQIAGMLGCTLGSVLRRVRKLDLPARPSPILRGVKPQQRDTDRHSTGYVAPARRAPPSFNRFIKKAPAAPPRAAAPAPAPDRTNSEPVTVGAGVSHPCQHLLAREPEPKLCGRSCYTPPGHDEPGEFCVFHYHFRGWP